MPLPSQSAVVALESLIYSSWSLTWERPTEVTFRSGKVTLSLCSERTFNINLDFFLMPRSLLCSFLFKISPKVQFFGSIM